MDIGERVHPLKKEQQDERERKKGKLFQPLNTWSVNHFPRVPAYKPKPVSVLPVSISSEFLCHDVVMMSASMSDVGRYVVLMAFRSQASRTKWKRTLMCLVAHGTSGSLQVGLHHGYRRRFAEAR